MPQIGEYKLKELRDSTLFYMNNPPRYTRYAAILIVAILLGVVIWASVTVKAEQVENQGTVVDTSIKSIQAEVSGTVIAVLVEEGDRVTFGDVLFKMDDSQATTDRDGYVVQKERYTQRLQLIDRYIDSIVNNVPNPFVDSGDEQEFYLLRVAYDDELAQIDTGNQKVTLYKKYLDNLYNSRSQLKETIITGDAYQKIIDDNKQAVKLWERFAFAAGSRGDNPFDPDAETQFYNMYQSYKWAFDQYEDLEKQGQGQAYQMMNNQITTANDKIKNYTDQINSNTVYVEKADAAKHRLEYVEEAIVNMEAGASANPFDPQSSDPVEIEYYKTYDALLSEISQQGLSDKADSAKDKALTSIYNERKNSSDQLVSQEANIQKQDATIAKYSVTAAATGTVHLDMVLNEGVQLQQGNKIGSINSKSGMQVEMQVSAHDRARLAVGQECKFTVDGLLQNEYGHINGTILSIAEDVTVSEKSSFFRIIVQFDEDHLTDTHGNEVDIVDGMSVKIWTTYEKSTYLQYFLERLGL